MQSTNRHQRRRQERERKPLAKSDLAQLGRQVLRVRSLRRHGQALQADALLRDLLGETPIHSGW